jgi:hypothetical protein
MVRAAHVQASKTHRIRATWQGLCTNPHVCTECNALIFLLVAIGAALAGWWVVLVVYGALALALCGFDIYSCLHKEED